MKNKTIQNTDRELWRKEEDYYSPSIHVTEEGAIGINVGGTVIIKEVEEWHKLATNGGWRNARIDPPAESGRYWCIVKEVNDLGVSYYQWNCGYNQYEKAWDQAVVYWMELPMMPGMIK
jgi:hypothetical protein